ncbi:TniQ family protein [Pseudomonas sp. NY15437]|uniref:TniQ family protein n=1 Tax=Pseudomonas sp. NY15437 TaxID=3400360 RepID=UPI003A875FB4
MLPFAPESFADESLTSYLQRLAVAHFVPSTQQLLRPAGLRTKRLFNVEELQQLAEYYALNREPLIAMARFSSSLGGLARGVFLRQAAAVCPQCLAEAPYLRQAWHHELLTACVHHGTALMDSCSACKRPISHSQGPLTRCRCGTDFSQQRMPIADAANLAVSALIGGEEHAVHSMQQQLGGLTALPDDIDTFVVFLANLTRAQRWRRGSPIPLREAEGLNRAAHHFLEDLPERFRAFVLQRIQQANQRQNSKFIAHLGSWYRQLNREFDRPEYAVVVQSAAQCLVQHAVAPINRKMKQIGSDLLGQKSSYTTAEAARLLGSSPDRIIAYVKAGRLRGQVLQGGANEYCLVARAEVEAQQRLANEVLTARDVQRLLNISRHLRERLVESGVLQRIPESQRPLFGRGDFWRAEVEQLKDRLMAAYVDRKAGTTISLEEINARRFPRDQVTELYRQIGAGRLRPALRLPNIEGLAALRFDQRELLAVVEPNGVSGVELSITDLTRLTRWKHQTIRGWIETGRLPCRREMVAGRERCWISVAQLIEFLSRNIVLADVAEQLNTKSAWLYPPLMSQGVTAQPGHSASVGIQRGLLISTSAVVNVASQRPADWRRSPERVLSETSHEDADFVNAEHVVGGRDDQAY